MPPQPHAPESSHRFIPTPFLTKTYQLVDDSSIDTIISWNEDGTSFVIWNPAEFARDVLPKFFKHSNFSSFIRQLNTYGFRKVMPDRWEFSNDCFRRGDKRLLCDIVRRKMTSVPSSVHTASALMDPSTSNSGEGGQVFSPNSTPSSTAPMANLFVDQSRCNISSSNGNNNSGNCIVGGGNSRANLMDENDRLKKENTQLCKELSQMKSMCTNIYSMMSNYNPGSVPVQVPGLGHGRAPLAMLDAAAVCGSSNSSQAETMMNPIDLMSSRRLLAAVVETRATQAVNEDDISLHPKLFGFQFGSKRARGESSSETAMEQDDLLQLQQPGSDSSR